MKVGGGLLADAGRLETVLAAIGAAARSRRILIVPGGGPFADAVRATDRQLGLSQTAAHWMAVLAMDQFAHVIVATLDESVLVENRSEIGEAFAARQVPVLAPSRWLRGADPLPHSWDVTSDSIAAWVAGQVDARQLVLVKPAGVSALSVGSGFSRTDLVDPYFSRALPRGIEVRIVPSDEMGAFPAAPIPKPRETC